MANVAGVAATDVALLPVAAAVEAEAPNTADVRALPGPVVAEPPPNTEPLPPPNTGNNVKLHEITNPF